MVKYGQYTKGYGNILTAGYGAMFRGIAHQLHGLMTSWIHRNGMGNVCNIFGIQTK